MSISPSPGDMTRLKPRRDDRAALDDDGRFGLWDAWRRIGGDQRGAGFLSALRVVIDGRLAARGSTVAADFGAVTI